MIVSLLVVMIIPQAFGVQMFRAHSSIYDMDFIDMEVLDIQTLFLDDTPEYFQDDADLLKITVKVTNNGYEFFTLHDKMFKVWAMDLDKKRSTPDKEVLEVVDNYETTYDVQLAVNYENFESRELFEECDYTNTLVHRNNPRTFTACFEVLRIWANESLNLDDEKKYFLVMMDNTQASSCPNCKKSLLSLTKPATENFVMPLWVENLFSWHAKGLVSDIDFQNSLDFLQQRGIITPQIPEPIPVEMTLEQKNEALKEYQEKIAEAMATNLYVSASNFYEPRYTDDFTGVLCRQQNNIVTYSGDFHNDDQRYDAVFFKLQLFDEFGNIVGTGLSKEVDLAEKEMRHFEVSSPYSGKVNYCLATVDSKFN